MLRSVAWIPLAIPAIAAGLLLLMGEPGRSQPAAPPKSLVLSNVTLYTGTSDQPITNGMLVVADGKIVYAGSGDVGIQLPRGSESRDMKGAVVIPGLVDTHSHIGVYPRPHVPANSDGNEMSGPVQPGVRALDSFMADDPGIRMAVAGGVTTANV